MRLQLLAPTLLLASHIGLAASSPVLIPTIYNGPGAFGSRWGTVVVVNNHSGEQFRSPGVAFLILCPIPEGCFSDQVPPGEFGGIVGPAAPNGLLLYLPKEDTEIAFMARFAAFPRNALGGGTELPIVREREFVRRTLHFPDLPILPFTVPIRTTLRIYGPDALPGTAVRVELRSWTTPTGPVEASTTVMLQIPAEPTSGIVFPAYAQVNLQEQFPPAVLHSVSYNVSVVPLPLSSGELPRVWAFITITDNATQEVTVQRPQ